MILDYDDNIEENLYPIWVPNIMILRIDHRKHNVFHSKEKKKHLNDQSSDMMGSDHRVTSKTMGKEFFKYGTLRATPNATPAGNKALLRDY